MAIAHEAPSGPSRLTRLLSTDFCPWANRFVYWLKEPVGWFALATAVSVFIGLYFAPIGWMMAASLIAVIAVGMAWPFVAVRAVACSLSAESGRVHEDDSCSLRFAVRNRLPLPIWGLAVEGYLDRRTESDEEASLPTVALAFVRGLSVCTYRFAIRPQLRGRYPDSAAYLTCSFPFGIWTAKKELTDIRPVTVWPKLFPITGAYSLGGNVRADSGNGNRCGRSGDFIGVRGYRIGDCIKQVNWVATARSDSLIVTERGGPQCATLKLIIDVSESGSREQIADRIRVAGSIASNLHHSSIPLTVRIGDRLLTLRRGHDGFVQLMDALADVPVDGEVAISEMVIPNDSASITISSDQSGNPVVRAVDPAGYQRANRTSFERVIDRNTDIAPQMSSFWTEVRDVNLVA